MPDLQLGNVGGQNFSIHVDFTRPFGPKNQPNFPFFNTKRKLASMLLVSKDLVTFFT